VSFPLLISQQQILSLTHNMMLVINTNWLAILFMLQAVFLLSLHTISNIALHSGDSLKGLLDMNHPDLRSSWRAT
jgi:hypothetical protein